MKERSPNSRALLFRTNYKYYNENRMERRNMEYLFSYILIGIIIMFLLVVSGIMDEKVCYVQQRHKINGMEIPFYAESVAIGIAFELIILCWPIRVMNDIGKLVKNRKK